MTVVILMIALMSASYLPAQVQGIKMNFTPESEKFAQATKQYQEIWSNEGSKMIEAMETVSRLRFLETAIPVIVFEGASSSGVGDKPLKLRASYPEEVKKATMIHELGHRLNLSLRTGRKTLTSTGCSFFIYMMYGQRFMGRALQTGW